MEYYLPKETGFAQNDTAGVLKKYCIYGMFHIPLKIYVLSTCNPQTLGSVSHHYLIL